MTPLKRIRVAYVDDSQAELTRFAERLSDRTIEVIGFAPPVNLDVSSILRQKPDLFLLDYELTKVGINDVRVAYRGGALAVALRDSFPDHPIVLFTRQTLFARPEYDQLKEIRPVFDETVFKHTVEQDPSAARGTLEGLARGFARVRQKRSRDRTALMQLVGATEEEEDLLVKAGPPWSKQQSEPTGEWRVTEAANWLRRVVLAYPGIMYDPLHAATALGIELSSFEKPQVQRFFKSARYTGVFAPPEGRWWRGRLYKAAQELLARCQMTGPTLPLFIQAFRKQYNANLRPAVCISSKTTPADAVCYVLHKPVKREYSLPYYPDTRPPVMDEARASFKAIREEDVLDELFDEQGQQLLSDIRKPRK
jgi:hypothetical protein